MNRKNAQGDLDVLLYVLGVVSMQYFSKVNITNYSRISRGHEYRIVSIASENKAVNKRLHLALCANRKMKPVIVSYDCADHDPIEKRVPDAASNVDFWMNFTIGPDMKGGVNFQVHIVTPNNLHGKKSDKFSIV